MLIKWVVLHLSLLLLALASIVAIISHALFFVAVISLFTTIICLPPGLYYHASVRMNTGVFPGVLNSIPA